MHKVPIILQIEAVECGAVSLQMILHYYEKYLSLEQLRVECGVSRDGSTAKSILQAAKRLGMECAGYKVEVEGLKEIQLPAIIHWEFNHFIVLVACKKKTVIVHDPAIGRVELSYEDLEKSFTGIVLQLTPGENFQKEGETKSSFRFLQQYIKGNKSALAFIVASGFFLTIIALILPIFNQLFLDRVLFIGDKKWLIKILCGMGILGILQMVLQGLQRQYVLKLKAKLAIVGNARFMWHALRLPIVFFQQRYTADVVSRQEDNESVAETIMELAPIGVSLVMIVVYIIMMYRYHSVLATIGVGGAIIYILVLRWSQQKSLEKSQLLQRDGGKLIAQTTSGIEMIETLKSSGIEQKFFEKWGATQAQYTNNHTHFLEANMSLEIIPTLIESFMQYSLLIVGSIYLLKGDLSIGLYIAFQAILTGFLGPLREITFANQTINRVQGEMNGIQDVLEYPVDRSFDFKPILKTSDNPKDKETVSELELLKGRIEFKDVSFGYNPLAEPLLKSFNLEIKEGETVALVGGSGSGKSTIGKLLAHLYEPWEGQIKIDGQAIETIPSPILTNSLVVVDQEISLFEGTIEENIRMWDKTISQERVVEACKMARIHENIMQRPEGYNHHILESGKNFSGGEKQRIEIARALVKKGSIIILDEATSALDAKTEYDIIQAVKKSRMTCIMIAHRLSTIRDCDQIVVLEEGVIVEKGTHEALLEQKGKYAELVGMQ